MTKKEAIWQATYAFDKLMDFETLYYSDNLNGHEEDAEYVWDFVIALRSMGIAKFRETHKGVKMYI